MGLWGFLLVHIFALKIKRGYDIINAPTSKDLSENCTQHL